MNWQKDGYAPEQLYRNDPRLHALLDAILQEGIGGKNFDSIARYLIQPDPYMVLADFNAYSEAQARVDAVYRDPLAWNQKSLVNIAKAGVFASDRAVREYADRIWKLKPVE